MRKIKIIAVGSLTPEFKKLFNKYKKSIGYFCTLNVVELKEFSEEKNVKIKKEKETINILNHIDKDSYIVLMTINAKQMDSINFSKMINNNLNTTFIIGGSDGIKEELIDANLKLSFSLVTFPHQLFRVMLAEQIYRAFNIINNKKYHK